MTYIIDRFEEAFALCEDEQGETVPIPREALPPSVREGDVMTLADGQYLPDPEATANRREQMRKKMRDLFE